MSMLGMTEVDVALAKSGWVWPELLQSGVWLWMSALHAVASRVPADL